jgi:hypothetical protein
MLELKIKMMESHARAHAQADEDDESDASSVASTNSNKSNGSGKSDGSNVFPTGMLVTINGYDYPVVRGPKGGLYSLRPDGKHTLSPAQVRNQFPQPKKSAAMEEADGDITAMNSSMASLKIIKKYNP